MLMPINNLKNGSTLCTKRLDSFRGIGSQELSSWTACALQVAGGAVRAMWAADRGAGLGAAGGARALPLGVLRVRRVQEAAVHRRALRRARRPRALRRALRRHARAARPRQRCYSVRCASAIAFAVVWASELKDLLSSRTDTVHVT